MPFSLVAENRIREAMAEGQFDNLPGAGQPQSLEEYFSAPAELRMAYSILKSANCVPAEVELLNEVSRLERAIADAADAAARQPLQRALIGRQTELAVLLEHMPRHQT
jgi:DnaJ-like protein